jgi:hypothetical protein
VALQNRFEFPLGFRRFALLEKGGGLIESGLLGRLLG